MQRIISLFKPLFTRHGKVSGIIFLVVSIAIVAVSVYYFVSCIGKPFMGIKLSFEENGWIVQTVDPNGSAGQAGITAGDIPVDINGSPAANFLSEFQDVELISGLLVQDITTVNTDGETISATLEGTHSSTEANIEFTSLFLVAFIFWATGFYTFLKRPENQGAFIFCLSGVVFGLLVSTTIAKDCLIPGAFWISAILIMIAPWMLVHFFLVLPEERKWVRTSPLLYTIYIIPAIAIVLQITIGYASGQIVPWFFNLRSVVTGLGLLSIALTVILNYFQVSSVRTRQQMKIILFTSLVALIPAFFLFIVPVLIWDQAILPPGVSVLFIGFLPVGMAFAIVTQRLMDIDVVIRRGVIYGLVTIIMVAILSSSIFYLLVSPNPLGNEWKFLIAVLLGIIAVILVGPVKSKIEILVDRLFYKDRFDYRQIIQSLNTSLNAMTETYEMSRLIVGTAVHTLNLTGGCLVTGTNSDGLKISVAQGIFTEIDETSDLMQKVSTRSRDTEFPNTATAIDPDIAYLIPLSAADNKVGILCMGNKVSRQDFSSDDLLLLDGIASAAAQSLHRAMLINEVSLRDTFVSIASHELRTPLTAVMGYADLLMRRDPSKETRDTWLESIVDSSARISSILDDLLNVSRIQSGRIRFKRDDINVAELIEERCSFMKEMTEKHEFQMEVQTGLPAITVDRDKLGQIVDNLLTNAVKYSPQGGRIVTSARYDPERGHVVIAVTDEGIGIGEEDRELLFTTFHRIQRPETQNIPGTGLGLYIAKEWTETMGGRIWLESELNKGSTFYLSFPPSAAVSSESAS